MDYHLLDGICQELLYVELLERKVSSLTAILYDRYWHPRFIYMGKCIHPFTLIMQSLQRENSELGICTQLHWTPMSFYFLTKK